MTKAKRILWALKKAKEDGIPIIQIIPSDQSPNVVRVTRHRVNKELGDEIIERDGNWILPEEYFDMNRAEFQILLMEQQIMIIHQDMEVMTSKVKACRIEIVLYIGIAIMMGYTMGSPNSADECAARFGYDEIDYGNTQEEEITAQETKTQSIEAQKE